MTRPSPEVLKCLPVLQVEIFDVLHRILPCRLPGSTGWENKPRTIASSKKLGGREEDLVPQCLQCGALKFVGQTQPTEPVEQIVGKQEQMEIGLVGEEMPGGDVAHHVLPFELFDEQLDARPIVVQAAEVEGVPGEIREQDLIVIPAEFEEGQPFVCADNHQSNPGRDFRNTCSEQVACARRSTDIACAQFVGPEVFALAFEAQQRMMGRPPTLDGIVANACPRLLAIDHQHGGVDIEDQP